MAGRPLKKVTEKMRMTGDELSNVHNSDEHHSLYDIYNLFAGKHPDIARAVEVMIEETFGKHEDLPQTALAPIREIDFILASAKRAAKSEYRNLSKKYQRILSPDDIAQQAIAKIITAGKYDQTMLKAQKIVFIKKCVKKAFWDLTSEIKTRQDRAKELEHAGLASDPLYKKRRHHSNDDNSKD